MWAVTLAACEDSAGANNPDATGSIVSSAAPAPVVGWEVVVVELPGRSQYSVAGDGDQAFVWGGLGDEALAAQIALVGPEMRESRMQHRTET